jgi:hypothetical protein
MKPTTLLDARVPQPGREAEYGVPAVLLPVLRAAYDARSECSDADVEVLDQAILRLLRPWIRRR